MSIRGKVGGESRRVKARKSVLKRGRNKTVPKGNGNRVGTTLSKATIRNRQGDLEESSSG